MLCAIIIILCLICNCFSNKFGFPLLLAFIVIGMVFGSDGIFKIEFNNFKFVEAICSVALIFIMFYGGFGTKWKAMKPVMVKATLLSSLGVVLTALLVGGFCHSVLKISILESLLIGAVLSSTDAASVFSILKTKKLSLKDGADALLEVESGSNDPFAYMLTVIVLSAMGGDKLRFSIPLAIFIQIFVGLVFGAIIAIISYKFMQIVKFDVDGFDAVFIIAVALLAYAVPSSIGGNGYLSVYIVGVMLGNVDLKNKKAMVHFFDGITSLMQILIFFLLGLLAFPSKIIKVAPISILVAMFLTFIARPLVIFIILKPFRVSNNQIKLVSWAGLRGASSIVFAILAKVNIVHIENDVFHIVFCVVLLSIAFQGTLLPSVSKKLNMINESGNVLKTFNDYIDDINLDYISLRVNKDHVWIGRKIKDLQLPPDCLLILIKRNNNNIIPNGNTTIMEEDVLILSAFSYKSDDDIVLREVLIDETHKWNNKSVAELNISKNSLVIMIKRDDEVVIPNGNTLIQYRDMLVLSIYK